MRILIAILMLSLTACGSMPSPKVRKQLADTLASERRWHAVPIESTNGPLMAYVPDRQIKNSVLTIYIEGDGLAWINSSQASSDPTPLDPLGLRLALAHPEGNVAYLARPCQYIAAESNKCSADLWLNHRYSNQVISMTSQAIDELKKRFQADQLVLVGYSGGGAVAALISVRRNDVSFLVTVAGNLDHAQWAKYHKLTPLDGSLNPANESELLSAISQIHFVGAEDKNTTPLLSRTFVNRLSAKNSSLIIVEGFDHKCCWESQWPKYWNIVRQQVPSE